MGRQVALEQTPTGSMEITTVGPGSLYLVLPRNLASSCFDTNIDTNAENHQDTRTN